MLIIEIFKSQSDPCPEANLLKKFIALWTQQDNTRKSGRRLDRDITRVKWTSGSFQVKHFQKAKSQENLQASQDTSRTKCVFADLNMNCKPSSISSPTHKIISNRKRTLWAFESFFPKAFKKTSTDPAALITFCNVYQAPILLHSPISLNCSSWSISN